MWNFLLTIWNLLGAAKDWVVFSVTNPGWALAIGLGVVVLVLWLGKKILTAPLAIAWRGIKAGARRVPGMARGATAAARARAPQARQAFSSTRGWITASNVRVYAFVAVLVGIFLIGGLYWKYSGTKPDASILKDPITWGKEKVGIKVKEETPAEKTTREAKEKVEREEAEKREKIFRADVQRSAQEIVKGVQDGSVGKATGDGVRKGYKALEKGVEKAFKPEESPTQSPSDDVVSKETETRALRDVELGNARKSIDEALKKLQENKEK
ncbi:MAG: hypothetical protein WCW77_03265 [Patescibacteria group bacterium]|jgi:hypothetical protein